MSRARLLVLVSAPLAACGALLAHSLAYRIVAPDGHERSRLLAQTGHGYLTYAHTFVGACVGLVLVGAVLRAGGAFAGRPRAWPFAALTPLGFLVQEHLERALGGHGALTTILEPAFLFGLLLQLPLALAAWLLARALLACADALSAPATRGVLLAAAPPAVEAPSAPAPPRLAALASGHAGRAPPLLA